MTPPKRWREGDACPCTGLHQHWPYPRCTRLKQRGGTRASKDQRDAVWRTYGQGCVADWEEGQGPAGGEGVADSVAQDVGSPPLSLRRILSDDGPRVR